MHVAGVMLSLLGVGRALSLPVHAWKWGRVCTSVEMVSPKSQTISATCTRQIPFTIRRHHAGTGAAISRWHTQALYHWGSVDAWEVTGSHHSGTKSQAI